MRVSDVSIKIFSVLFHLFLLFRHEHNIFLFFLNFRLFFQELKLLTSFAHVLSQGLHFGRGRLFFLYLFFSFSFLKTFFILYDFTLFVLFVLRGFIAFSESAGFPDTSMNLPTVPTMPIISSVSFILVSNPVIGMIFLFVFFVCAVSVSLSQVLFFFSSLSLVLFWLVLFFGLCIRIICFENTKDIFLHYNS